MKRDRKDMQQLLREGPPDGNDPEAMTEYCLRWAQSEQGQAKELLRASDEKAQLIQDAQVWATMAVVHSNRAILQAMQQGGDRREA